MAAEGTSFYRDICGEMTCSICLGCFKHPVVIPECGHNFCRACLDQYWGKSGSEVSCPQCRIIVQRRMVAPNRPLVNLMHLASESNLCGEKRGKEFGGLCDEHQEPQKLFCWDDEIPICVVCDRSKEHKRHKVIPLEEACRKYKNEITNCMKTLRHKKEKVLAYQAYTNTESQSLLEQIKAEKEKTVVTFRQAHQFLEDQEKLLLARMEEMVEGIEREKDKRLLTLSAKLQSLENVIQEMEERLQQSTADLLQDLDSFLDKCHAEKSLMNFPRKFPVALKWRLWDFCDISYFLKGIVKQFQDSFVSGLQLQKANVHFNPNSAHPKLRVSRDYRTATGKQMNQKVADNPERFNKWPIVLGCEEFTTGRHFWEISAAAEEVWAVGVARKSLARKGDITFCPEGGLWTMGKWQKAYRSSSTAPNAPLSLNKEPRRIRVALNYEGGRVAFYDADRGILICAYPGISFTREIICPFFYLS